MELMRAENGPPNTGTCCVGVDGAADGLYRPEGERNRLVITKNRFEREKLRHRRP